MLNVEICRLHTWVDDEGTHLFHVAEHQAATEPLTSQAIWAQYDQHKWVNNVHRVRLQAIYSLPRYCGHTNPGTRLRGMEDVEGPAP
jgi:hypothetical protein